MSVPLNSSYRRTVFITIRSRPHPVVVLAHLDVRGGRAGAHLGVVALLYFGLEEAEILCRLGQVFLSSDGTVARDDHVHVPLHYFVDGLHPFGDMRVVAIGDEMEKSQVRREKNLMLRKVGHHIAPSVRGADETELHGVAADAIDKVVFKRYGRRGEFARLSAVREALLFWP